MFGIDQKLERAAQKGAALTAAFIVGSVGCAFLTGAAWLLLTEIKTPLFAATVIGAAYLGVAGIIAAIGLRRPSDTHHNNVKTADLSPAQLVAVSFLQGFEDARRR